MGRVKDLEIDRLNEIFWEHDPEIGYYVQEEEDEMAIPDYIQEMEPDPNSDCDSNIDDVDEEVEIMGPCPSGQDREVVVAIIPRSVLIALENETKPETKQETKIETKLKQKLKQLLRRNNLNTT